MPSWDQDDFWGDGAQNTSTDVQQGGGGPQWGSKSEGVSSGGQVDTSAPGSPDDPRKDGGKAKSKDSKMFLVIGAIILVIAIVAAVIVGVMHKRETSGSVSVGTSQVRQYQQGQPSQGTQGGQSSQGTQGQSSQQGSTSQGTPGIQGDDQSQQGGGSHSKEPNTSWDSTTPPNPNAELKGVSELPQVAKEGESAGIVYSKHVYEVGGSYLYALVVSISVGEQKDVDFFVSKDTFASVSTGSIVQVKFTQYSNGKVGINSISRN